MCPEEVLQGDEATVQGDHAEGFGGGMVQPLRAGSIVNGIVWT